MRLLAHRTAAYASLPLRVPYRGLPAEARSAKAGPRSFALGGIAPRLGPRSYVADGASLVGDAELGEHSRVWFCAGIRGDNGSIRIGCHSNVQDGAVIHCLPDGEVVIGAQVSVGHLATVHGASIGDRC